MVEKVSDNVCFLINTVSNCKWFLTGSFTDQPIVSYNDEQNLGIRLLNIPFEDIFYCFNILVLVVAVYEYQLSKMFSIKNN